MEERPALPWGDPGRVQGKEESIGIHETVSAGRNPVWHWLKSAISCRSERKENEGDRSLPGHRELETGLLTLMETDFVLVLQAFATVSFSE
jgi:hypothetical protein